MFVITLRDVFDSEIEIETEIEIEIAKERGLWIIQYKRGCIVHANGHFCRR